jgi:ElaB/YqjD/DUF883 family membrane-anchored ribosome-binding protein
MTQTTAATRDKLMADLRVVITDAEELLKLTAGQAGDKVAELRERMQARMVQAKDELANLQTAAVGQAREAAKATDHFVHESPWTAVGIAAGVGLIAGLLIGRR